MLIHIIKYTNNKQFCLVTLQFCSQLLHTNYCSCRMFDLIVVHSTLIQEQLIRNLPTILSIEIRVAQSICRSLFNAQCKMFRNAQIFIFIDIIMISFCRACLRCVCMCLIFWHFVSVYYKIHHTFIVFKNIFVR